MNAPVRPPRPARLTGAERQALEKLLASDGEKNREKNVYRAPEIRRLALDGLDNKAIAALTGASIPSVSTVVARMRRRHAAVPKRNGAAAGLLIDLPDDLRGRLHVEAARRGIGANSLANLLLTEFLRRDGVSKLLGD